MAQLKIKVKVRAANNTVVEREHLIPLKGGVKLDKLGQKVDVSSEEAARVLVNTFDQFDNDHGAIDGDIDIFSKQNIKILFGTVEAEESLEISIVD